MRHQRGILRLGLGDQFSGLVNSTGFPLAISSSGRYLKTTAGNAFFVNGDTPWSIAVQLTEAQVDTYISDRAAKGFTAIMFNLIEHYFSSNSPAWENANGDQPFGTIDAAGANVDFTDPTEAYWLHVDYIVDAAEAAGIVCFVQPAYLGVGGGSGSVNDQGWDSAVNNESAGDLQTYGAFLANRYPNVIWVMGGDYAPPTPATQWNIATGIRSVDSSAIITGHPGRSDAEAYPTWNGQTGFNLNSTYGDGVEYDISATAYARSGPLPFVFLEGYYDGESASAADCRRQAYASILSGACGHFFGNNPIWGFGEPNANGGSGAASALSGSLSTTATSDMAHVAALFEAYSWELLVPTTDTSLVTTSLGSGTSRVIPALASDGSFAMIWKPASGSVTVDMTAFTPSSVRARFYDPTDGSYSAVSGSPFANTGTQVISFTGEAVLVMDAAP